VSSSANFHSDLLASMALYREFLLVKRRVLDVVHVDSSVFFLLGQNTSVLPSKDVKRALADWHERVIRAELKPVEMPVGKNSGLGFLGRLNLEPTLDHLGRLAEVSVLIDLD
jgi:hypothetical protein